MQQIKAIFRSDNDFFLLVSVLLASYSAFMARFSIRRTLFAGRNGGVTLPRNLES